MSPTANGPKGLENSSAQRLRALRLPVLVAFLCSALVMYMVLLGRSALLMIGSGRPAAMGLGAALLTMPLIGSWAMVATLREGFTHQRMTALIAEDGMELDVSALPRRPSGRIDRDAADALFQTVRDELEQSPYDWRCWYRLGRAYEHAGDRRRARSVLRTAASLLEGR